MVMSEMQEMRRRHDDLEQRFVIHEVEDQQKWDNMLQEMKVTQATVSELVEATRNLRDSTSDLLQIIEAWRSMNGVIKAGTMLGRFVTWLAGFAVVGAFITWFTAK